jgi:hypothetical protein
MRANYGALRLVVASGDGGSEWRWWFVAAVNSEESG